MTNMRRFRFSLASLMSSVLLIAVACAALRYASELWASVAFTLTVGLLFGATLCVVFRGGDARAFCLGFALFGWGYLFIAFGPWFRGKSSPQPPDLLTSKLLAYAHPELSKTVTLPGNGPIRPRFVSVVLHDSLGLGLGTVLVPAWEHFQQVGHSLVALLIALMGGGLARYIDATHCRREDRPGGSQP